MSHRLILRIHSTLDHGISVRSTQRHDHTIRSTPTMRSFFAAIVYISLGACSGLSQNSNAVRPHENGFTIQISPTIKRRAQFFSTTTALCLLCWTMAVPPTPCLASETNYVVIPLQEKANERLPQTLKHQRLPPPSERRVEDLQDLRLDQCEERGSNWEQCFFYGTDTVSVGTKGQLLKTRENAKSGPPTW
jgi:hypothetical protein